MAVNNLETSIENLKLQMAQSSQKYKDEIEDAQNTLKRAADQAAQKIESLTGQIEEKEALNTELRNKEKEKNEELREQGDKIDSLNG